MVNTELRRGGAARMAATLASAINECQSGIEVTFYHCSDRSEELRAIGLKRAYSRPLNALLSRLGGSTLVCDFGVAKELIRRAGTVDVLHIHNLHGYYLDYVGLLSEWKDRPIVWTWHDMWGATGRCGFSHGCERWKVGCMKCPHKEYSPSAWVDCAHHEYELKQRLYNRMSQINIVTPSRWLRDIAVRRGFATDQVRVIANPVDLTAYNAVDKEVARHRLGFPLNEMCLLFVAANCNDNRKGYSDFEEVSNMPGVHAVVVGKRPRSTAPHVTCVGAISNPRELAAYYSAADALVLTSRADNYPNTVIEAMACGTPVIGYAVGGVPSQMPDDWDGIVEGKNIEAVRKRIAQLTESGGKNPALAKACRKYALQEWSPKQAALKYMRLYQQITRLGAVVPT